KEAKKDPGHDLVTLEKQATNRLLLVPEFAPSERRFTFRHDSLRSYFCARYLHQQFISDPNLFVATATFDSGSLLFFLAIVKNEQAAHSILSNISHSEVHNQTYRKDILGVLTLYWAIDNKKLNSDYFRDFCANAPPPMRALLVSNLSNRDFSSL